MKIPILRTKNTPMRFTRAVAVLTLSHVAAPAHAATITYSDGGTHVFGSTTTDTIIVSNGTTLDVITGAIIAPTQNFATAAVYELSTGTTVNVTGGILVGSAGYDALGVSPESSVNISGGVFQGGAGGHTGLAIYTYISGTPPIGSHLISGGTFVGGSGGGPGADIYGNATISGGTFVAGPGGSIPFALGYSGNPGDLLTIRGGTFSGSILIVTGDPQRTGGVVDILGSGLSYSGGIVSGTLLSGTPIDNPVVLAGTDSTFPILVTPTEIRFGAPLPEPASAVLLGLGLAGLAAHVGLRAERRLPRSLPFDSQSPSLNTRALTSLSDSGHGWD